MCDSPRKLGFFESSTFGCDLLDGRRLGKENMAKLTSISIADISTKPEKL